MEAVLLPEVWFAALIFAALAAWGFLGKRRVLTIVGLVGLGLMIAVTVRIFMDLPGSR